MVETLAVVAEIPSLAQGETTERPRPVPSRIRISEKAAAPTAPANTAPQETALLSPLVDDGRTTVDDMTDPRAANDAGKLRPMRIHPCRSHDNPVVGDQVFSLRYQSA